MATFPEQAITLASHRGAASSIQRSGKLRSGKLRSGKICAGRAKPKIDKKDKDIWLQSPSMPAL